MDEESGLLYFRARHYDPALGLFIQRDPIGFAGGDMNLYAYVWNDPHNFTDPSWLSATADMAIVSGASMLALGIMCANGTICPKAGDLFQGGYDSGFNNGFGSGANGNSPPPVGEAGVVGKVAAGLGALIGNAMGELKRQWEEYISQIKRNSGPGTGPGIGGGPGSGMGDNGPPEDRDPALTAMLAFILADAVEGPKTRGKTTIQLKSGGMSQANKDFDALVGTNPTKDIMTQYGPGRVGNLPGGVQVIVRPGSSQDGLPTLQVIYGPYSQMEIRYGF